MVRVRVWPPNSGAKKGEVESLKKNNSDDASIYSKASSRTSAGLSYIAVICFSLAGTEHFFLSAEALAKAGAGFWQP